MTEIITFLVVGYSYKKKAGKDPVYKVQFRNENGHSLTLVGGSKEIYSGFPIDTQVDMEIVKAQKTLDEGPKE